MKLSYRIWSGVQSVVLGLSLTIPAFADDAPTSVQAPTANDVKQVKEGELSGDVKGINKQKLTVGKFDPPAAFNLEDIQDFPEERLQPVLNNPITFDEGRDFSTMLDFQDEQMDHPWLPELTKAPFLVMRATLDKPSKDWTFSIVDQGGTPVSTQTGKGAPPATLTWNGDDSVRDHAAVDTVYIAQLATTDREGYHHTYTGQPVQFSSLLYDDGSKKVIELSSKRLFADGKSDFTKEAFVLLDKVCDIVRENAQSSFTIQPYDSDSGLAAARSQAMAKYFSDNLYIPISQIQQAGAASADKRGSAIAIFLNGGGNNP